MMRSWHIIVANLVASTVTGVLLFLPGALPWRPESAALLRMHWPAIAIVWLGSYGVVALVLTTLTVFLEIRGVAPRQAGPEWAGRYVVRLAVSQYFTSVLALLGLGLSRVPIETAPFLVLPNQVAGSPALAACGAVVAAGLLGGLFLTAAIVGAESPEPRPRVPGMRADRLIREVIEPPPTQEPASPNQAADIGQLAALIEQGQRPILEALKDLAIAVRRLRWDLDDIKLGLQDQALGRSGEAGSASPSVVEDAATELRTAAAAFDASVARLGEMAALLSADGTLGAGGDAPLPPGSRSQLSNELQALLRDLSPAADNRDLPG